MLVLCQQIRLLRPSGRQNQTVRHRQSALQADQRGAESDILRDINHMTLFHLSHRLECPSLVRHGIDLLEHFAEAYDRHEEC